MSVDPGVRVCQENFPLTSLQNRRKTESEMRFTRAALVLVYRVSSSAYGLYRLIRLFCRLVTDLHIFKHQENLRVVWLRLLVNHFFWPHTPATDYSSTWVDFNLMTTKINQKQNIWNGKQVENKELGEAQEIQYVQPRSQGTQRPWERVPLQYVHWFRVVHIMLTIFGLSPC